MVCVIVWLQKLSNFLHLFIEGILMRFRFIFVYCLVFLMLGCANVQNLRSVGSVQIFGPNPDSNEEPIEYQVESIGGVEVGFHLEHFRQGQILGGYKLALLFVNNSTEVKAVTPSVQLLDRSNVVVPPDSYPLFVDTLRSLGAATSSYPPKETSTRRFSGTITNSNDGTTYSVTGKTRVRENQGTSFARGADELLVAVKKKTADKLGKWGARNWLFERYDLSPKTKTLGVVFFNTLKPRKGPLTLVLEVNGVVKRISLSE
jgi:hypothetical protein